MVRCDFILIWLPVCACVCVCITPFSISAFKADHVCEWEMIRDGLVLCCSPEEIQPPLTPHFYIYEPFQQRQQLSCRTSLPVLDFHLRQFWKEKKKKEDSCLFYPLLFPVCAPVPRPTLLHSAVTQNQRY